MRGFEKLEKKREYSFFPETGIKKRVSKITIHKEVTYSGITSKAQNKIAKTKIAIMRLLGRETASGKKK